MQKLMDTFIRIYVDGGGDLKLVGKWKKGYNKTKYKKVSKYHPQQSQVIV